MDARKKTLYLLATVDGIDCNVAAQTTLYTCPAGYTCYITKIVLRDLSAAMNTLEISCGWDTGTALDVIANAGALTITILGYHIPAIKSDAVRGNAAETLEIDIAVAEVGLCNVDVFGYLVPV